MRGSQSVGGGAGSRWDQPVEPVLQSQLDGAQVRGVGDYCAVCGILDQIHRTGERSGNLCNTHIVSRCVWNYDTLLRRSDSPVSADAPTVMSCSIPTMMRSHSSSRLRSPHSPISGLYISSLISSGVTGIPPPSVSGCGSARQHRDSNLIICSKNLGKVARVFFN